MTKIECPKCKKQPTGKYRDEMSIDGMYCRPCSIAWNVDWENQKQLYDTAKTIIDEFNVVDFHIETIESVEEVFSIVNEKLYEHIDHYIPVEKFSEIIHDLQKLKRYIRYEK